ncbi:MAG TPA: HipA N-terminal domain-containing protein [Cyclobacteriaceae bacterium]|nr:HipA N-terminal domain-containing protein [Cyclobacteriaceae bacterium]
MKEAHIYNNSILAGKLTLTDEQEFVFRYADKYFLDTTKPAISLTLPKAQQEYRSPILFPFFFNMLSEGVNKRLQSRQFQIDENDSFSLLINTATSDTIGAITVKPVP